MGNLEHYQGRSLGPMFSEGFRYESGYLGYQRVLIHFVLIGGEGNSHIKTGLSKQPGIDCPPCMAVAARAHRRQGEQGYHNGKPMFPG